MGWETSLWPSLEDAICHTFCTSLRPLLIRPAPATTWSGKEQRSFCFPLALPVLDWMFRQVPPRFPLISLDFEDHSHFKSDKTCGEDSYFQVRILVTIKHRLVTRLNICRFSSGKKKPNPNQTKPKAELFIFLPRQHRPHRGLTNVASWKSGI